MNDEEILKAARAGKSYEGEAEIAISKKSYLLSLIVCVLICIITFLIKYFNNNIDYSELAIMFLIAGVSVSYYGVKFSEKKKIIWGSLFLLLGIISYGLFIGVMIK